MKTMMILLTLFLINTSYAATSNSKSKMTETVEKAKTEATDKSKLDDVIRGEMAAVETYNQVIEKVTNQKEKEKLTALRNDHKAAVEKLQNYASPPVKKDAKDSGAWGTFAKAWTGGAKVFGDETAMKALKQGEEHGVKEYERLLEDEKVSTELKQTVRTQLLPKQREHIKTLEQKI